MDQIVIVHVLDAGHNLFEEVGLFHWFEVPLGSLVQQSIKQIFTINQLNNQHVSLMVFVVSLSLCQIGMVHSSHDINLILKHSDIFHTN